MPVSFYGVPVGLFAFARPDHTRRTLDALAQNEGSEQTDLFVFSDGPRSSEEKARVEEVREIVSSFSDRFRSVSMKKNESNKGLIGNVMDGIGRVFSGFDRAIFLEDDLVTAPDFLRYMNQALRHYAENQYVRSVTGYLYPVRQPVDSRFDTLLSPRFCCWGWGTWKNRWQTIDWALPSRTELLRNREPLASLSKASNDLPEILLDRIDGHNKSWAIQVALDHVLHEGYAVYPVIPLVNNIGMDGSGTHFRVDRKDRRNSAIDSEQIHFTGNWPQEPVFAENYVPSRAAPFLRLSANSWGRRLKNWVRYGRSF